VADPADQEGRALVWLLGEDGGEQLVELRLQDAQGHHGLPASAQLGEDERQERPDPVHPGPPGGREVPREALPPAAGIKTVRVPRIV
jgi:hypothetical protein